MLLLPTAEQAHDDFMALGRAYALDPNPARVGDVLRAHRRFYISFTGSPQGLEEAQADLVAKMVRTAATRVA